MVNCSLSKNKSYEVQKISFNSSENSYQLTLAQFPASCPTGIFSSKKLELKVVSDNRVPFLHFNKQDGVPELVLNNLALVERSGSVSKETQFYTHQPSQLQPLHAPQEKPHLSFLYIIFGIVVVILLIRYFMKQRTQKLQSYVPNNPNAMTNYSPNNFNNANNPNTPGPYANNNYQGNQGQQPPSRAASFMTGLAGGAVGAVVGNALYEKFSGGHEAHAAQPLPQQDSSSMFSSDNNDNSSSNFDSNNFYDDSGSDMFSSDD